MPTPKQIAARRANARLSQGPTTPAGKAASSQNALKFGLTAKRTLVPGESGEQWQEFHAEFMEELQPEGPTETHFAERVIHFAWIMRRVPVVEAETLSHHVNEVRKEDVRAKPVIWTDSTGITMIRSGDPQSVPELPAVANELGRAFIRDCQNGQALTRMSRHTATIERAFQSALNNLERLRAQRKQAQPAEPNLQLQNDLTEGLTGVPATA